MKIDMSTGLLSTADYIPSPNCNQRPKDIIVDLLVLHGISLPAGEFGGPAVIALFTNTLDVTAHPSFVDLCDLRVSAHVFIRRDGELIQFVPLHLRAWHAGVSAYEGREGCNDFSIGIELEGVDDRAYTELQYQQLNSVIDAIQKAYPLITDERIVGHCDIAPGRKTDPGPAFNWDNIRNSNHDTD